METIGQATVTLDGQQPLWLSAHERGSVRQGLTLPLDHYDKIAKSAEKVLDFHIKAAADAESERLVSLRTRFQDEAAPSGQLSLLGPEPIDSLEKLAAAVNEPGGGPRTDA